VNKFGAVILAKDRRSKSKSNVAISSKPSAKVQNQEHKVKIKCYLSKNGSVFGCEKCKLVVKLQEQVQVLENGLSFVPGNLPNTACSGRAGGVAPAQRDSAPSGGFCALAFSRQVPCPPLTLAVRRFLADCSKIRRSRIWNIASCLRVKAIAH